MMLQDPFTQVHNHQKNIDKCGFKLLSIGHLSISSCISDASKGGDSTVSPGDWSLTTNMKKFSFSPFLITISHFPICVHCFFFYCLSYLGIFNLLSKCSRWLSKYKLQTLLAKHSFQLTNSLCEPPLHQSHQASHELVSPELSITFQMQSKGFICVLFFVRQCVADT